MDTGTEVRHLPPWARARLGGLLEDRTGQWQTIMAAIPDTPPWTPGTALPPQSEQYATKYTAQDIRLLENEVLSGRPTSGGLCLLLEEWGCSGVVRPTLGDLVRLLDRHKLLAAAAFLRRDVFKESSTDDTTEQFQNLDLLVDEKERAAENIDAVTDRLDAYDIDIVATLDYNLTTNTNQVQEFNKSFVGVPELDNLLAEHSTDHNMSSQVSGQQSQSTSNIFSSLEKLSKISSDENGAPDLSSIRQIEFDSSIPLVPHMSYNLLHQTSNGFCNTPYCDGGRKLGEGAFGVVYKADMPENFILGRCSSGKKLTLLRVNELSDSTAVDHALNIKELAVKKLNFADERIDKQFKVEVEILSQCNHPNILPLEGYSCDGPHWCLVYAFMLHGNLQDRLACNGSIAPLTPSQRMTIGEGIAQGLVYLHTFRDTPMIHRDIKSANILLDSHLLPKIGDFGLVRMGSKGTCTETLVGTTTVFGTSAYMAPEAFRGDVSTKLDSFSYGVVLLEILTGLPPYDEDRDGRDLLSHIQATEAPADDLSDARAAPWPAGLPQALLDMAMLCFEDRKTRPAMVDVACMWPNILHKWHGP